jgi:hypothetical protein
MKKMFGGRAGTEGPAELEALGGRDARATGVVGTGLEAPDEHEAATKPARVTPMARPAVERR